VAAVHRPLASYPDLNGPKKPRIRRLKSALKAAICLYLAKSYYIQDQVAGVLKVSLTFIQG
jgi:hypothetical protein